MFDFKYEIAVPAMIIACLGLIIGFMGLIIGILNFLRKTGNSFRAGYQPSYYYTSKHNYIRRLTVENRKDKTVAILSVYLRYGYNLYIEMENFGDEPLLLKSYESFQKLYDVVDDYKAGMYKVDLPERVMLSINPKDKIVIFTTDGRFIAKPFRLPLSLNLVSFL